MRVINEKWRASARRGPRAASGFALSTRNALPRRPLGHQRHGVRVGGGQRAVPLRVGERARNDRQGPGEVWRAAPGQFRGELRDERTALLPEPGIDHHAVEVERRDERAEGAAKLASFTTSAGQPSRRLSASPGSASSHGAGRSSRWAVSGRGEPPSASATGKGADSTASLGGRRARSRSRPAAWLTDRDHAGHGRDHPAHRRVSLRVPSPQSEETDVDPSLFSLISSTGGSSAVLWYRLGGRPRAPAVGGWRSSASSPRATSAATTPATTVRDSPVSSSSSSRVKLAELAKVARMRRSTSAMDEPWPRRTAHTRPPGDRIQLKSNLRHPVAGQRGESSP